MRPSGILIASGSEVSLAIKAQERLFKLGEDVSVVSMPSMERFDAQPQNYKDQVLPPSVRRRTAIEMGSTRGWERYVGLDGTMDLMNSAQAAQWTMCLQMQASRLKTLF